MLLLLVDQVDLDGAEVDESSSDDSDSDGGDSMDEDMAEAAPAAVPIKQPPPAPVVDADGFELVQKRRGRR